ncbi:MAG: DUF2946 family protein [Lysobacter sp.]|nr:DUF2946 family protein [Lysobacter sp.]
MSPLRRQRPLLLSLAFAASLLLSLLPTIGRLHQALNPDPMASAWNAMCTMRGLVVLPAPLQGLFAGTDAAAEDRGDRSRGEHAGDDCPYCPLLAAVVLLAGMLLAWLSPRLHDAAFAQRRGSHSLDRYLLGLGPRGPPQARIAI